MYPSVSLVLSSGGARGVAHIGVIEELERQGFEIRSIAGSSMGALVGGIYASGNLQAYKEWMCSLDKEAVFNLIDFTLSTNGLVLGSKVIKKLQQIVPDEKIEDLPIFFTAVATDIVNNKEVVFDKGNLFEAICASISIPTFLNPSKLNGDILIDGGVLNPIPINRIKRRKDDLLIVVDVNSPIPSERLSVTQKSSKEEETELNYSSFIRKKRQVLSPNIKEEPLNYYTLLAHSVNLMMQQISAMTIELYQPDFIIKIPMDSYGDFLFYKSEEIIKSGELATHKALFDF